MGNHQTTSARLSPQLLPYEPLTRAGTGAARAGLHTLSDGVRVRLEATRISVERSDGTSLFTYEAGAAHGKITLAAESLAFAASAGDLTLSAAGAIHLESHSLSARMGMPGSETTLYLEPRRARLTAHELALSSTDFKLDVRDAELTGTELRGSFKRAVLTLAHLDTVADVMVCRARNVYQSVHELLQQQVGSLRTLVSGTAQLKAREITQRAEDGYKIRGEKIHIG
jgi:hypothetical protein